ncbi:MAG: hypothetical protein V2A79_11325 [Planctomycetota bacterium]
MRLLVSITMGLAGLILEAPESNVPSRVEEALREWETPGKNVDYRIPRYRKELQSRADTVRTQTPKGNAPVIDRLVAIATNEDLHIEARCLALQVGCELANEEIVQRLLGTLTALLRLPDILDKSKPLEAGVLRSPQGRLVTTLGYATREYWFPLLNDHTPLFDVITAYHLVAGCSGETAQWGELCVSRPRGCFDLIQQCRVPIEQKREAVVKIVAKRWRRGVSEEIQFQLPDYLELFDPVVFPRLRELVRAENTPDQFHWGAADILSFFGDTEIVADLERRRAPFGAVHIYHEQELQLRLWRIQAQHPPTGLLEHIAGPDWRVCCRERRAWAVCRALSLGIPAAQIREAILKHHKRAKTKEERVDLVELKWLGLELGILQKDDMPDIDLSSQPKVTI